MELKYLPVSKSYIIDSVKLDIIKEAKRYINIITVGFYCNAIYKIPFAYV